MTQSSTDRSFILVFRLLMAWTFLYAASHQVFNPKFSAAAFLSHTKTFHDVYAVLATPAADPRSDVPGQLWSPPDRAFSLGWLNGSRKRGLWSSASAHVLDGTHGLAVH